MNVIHAFINNIWNYILFGNLIFCPFTSKHKINAAHEAWPVWWRPGGRLRGPRMTLEAQGVTFPAAWSLPHPVLVPGGYPAREPQAPPCKDSLIACGVVSERQYWLLGPSFSQLTLSRQSLLIHPIINRIQQKPSLICLLSPMSSYICSP